MRFKTNYGPLLRAAAVLSAVTVLVAGVTFASLQSQAATLTGNNIQSATADLRIGTSSSTFDASHAGFTFKDVVPGGPAMPADGNIFYLKDYGTAKMSLKLSLGSTPVNTSAVDLAKVKLILSRVDTASADQTIALSDLAASGLALTDPILPGSAGIAQYKLRVAMDADAFQGSGAAITGMDLVFSGTATN